jgi:hypothetical protein
MVRSHLQRVDSRLLCTWRSLTRTLQFLSGTKWYRDAGSRPSLRPATRQSGAIRIYARRTRPRPPLDCSMSAPEQKVELVETKDLRMFIPVLQEVDFGDQFLLSMLHWCGFSRRSTPLDYWKVFFIALSRRCCGSIGTLPATRNGPKHMLGRLVCHSPGFSRTGTRKERNVCAHRLCPKYPC